MKEKTMTYEERIEKVLNFIGKHVDDYLTLDELSSVACFSKYHFHRLFTQYTGLTLAQYIKWLRLKRAAHQLIFEKKRSITDIALGAGFETHESFSRAFKELVGVPPRVFRVRPQLSLFERPIHFQPKHEEGGDMITVTIKNLPERRLAVVEHRGDPKNLGESINKLVSWAHAQAFPLKLVPGEAFGFAYDDPKRVQAEEFRFDLGMTVPRNLKLSSDVVEKVLPAGSYASAIYKGPRTHIGDTVYALYRDWLPQSNLELGDLPCVFCYHNFSNEVAESESLTECLLLLK